MLQALFYTFPPYMESPKLERLTVKGITARAANGSLSSGKLTVFF